MANLTAAENLTLNRLLEKKRGFVLDFDKNSFIDFFRDEFEVDITSHPYYGIEEYQHKDIPNFIGCLRTFFERESNQRVGRAVELLVDRAKRLHESEGNQNAEYHTLIEQGYAIARRLQCAKKNPEGEKSIPGILGNPYFIMAGLSAPPHAFDIEAKKFSSIARDLSNPPAYLQKMLDRPMPVLSSYSTEMVKLAGKLRVPNSKMLEHARSLCSIEMAKLAEKLRADETKMLEHARSSLFPSVKDLESIDGIADAQRELLEEQDVPLTVKTPQALLRPHFSRDEIFEMGVSEKDEFVVGVIKKIDFDKAPIEDEYKGVLKKRLDETVRCFKGGNYLAAIVIAGSILECVFQSFAKKHPEKFKGTKNVENLKFSDLIIAFEKAGILSKAAIDFSNMIRARRNYIHLYERAQSEDENDAESIEECLLMLRVILRRLK